MMAKPVPGLGVALGSCIEASEMYAAPSAGYRSLFGGMPQYHSSSGSPCFNKKSCTKLWGSSQSPGPPRYNKELAKLWRSAQSPGPPRLNHESAQKFWGSSPLLRSGEDPSSHPLGLGVRDGEQDARGRAHVGRAKRASTPGSTPDQQEPPVLENSSTMAAAIPELAASRSQRRPVEEKAVWIWTTSKEVFTAAIEKGWDKFVVSKDDEQSTTKVWAALAKAEWYTWREEVLMDADEMVIGRLKSVASASDLVELYQFKGSNEVLIMDASDWQIIPAENVVAEFQGTGTRVFGLARSAQDARNMLEALEKGMDGVILKTEDPAEIHSLKSYVSSRARLLQQRVQLRVGTVTRVAPVGMGDRVCIDLCSLLQPGEGILTGSFARALFLVHSECLLSNYIASRPFRVNAGPVHAYCASSGERTQYLSELRSGDEVMVVDASGASRSAVVGRVKIETRPLVLVEAEVDGETHSILLQNAETVRLVVPGDGPDAQALSVTNMLPGDKVLLYMQHGARHTGIAVEEFIVEK